MRTTTTNGAGAHQHTENPLVDLFFKIGASRNNLEGIRNDFKIACKSDKLKAIAILLWARDIRHNGAGERQVFRTLLTDLLSTRNSFGVKVVSLIPEIGRFDDFKVAYGTYYENQAAKIWSSAIKEKNVLAAKWADRKDRVLQRYLGLNEAGLRKKLASIRKDFIPEAKMCAKAWDTIDYDKLPSVAGMRYAKAFGRNDSIRYGAFIASNETTVNASASFPHDVYRMYRYGDQKEAASKYWEALPDLLLEGSILPVADVSGSMMCTASGKITCMDVSISLGVYLSQRCKGPFQDTLITFSERPTLVSLPKTKDIGQLFSFVERMDWGGTTNIESTYTLVLDRAVKMNATQDQMPKFILILSDMQFNTCNGSTVYNYSTRQYENRKSPETIYENMRKKFKAAGYELPKIIFWNLNAGYGNTPVTAEENGTGLVSGFSPNVLKAVLSAKEVTPVSIMEEAIIPFIEMLK